MFIKDFFLEYIQKLYDKSKIPTVRKIIQGNKHINNFIASNDEGLEQIFNGKKNKRGVFNLQSIQSLFPSLPGIKKD
jgi:hypothetical protein